MTDTIATNSIELTDANGFNAVSGIDRRVLPGEFFGCLGQIDVGNTMIRQPSREVIDHEHDVVPDATPSTGGESDAW
jgi:hypothetical protein